MPLGRELWRNRTLIPGNDRSAKPSVFLVLNYKVCVPFLGIFTTMSNVNSLKEWIKKDKERMRALHTVAEFGLKDWLIAAGFVRNLIWDKLHGTSTKLNDIDVIYYDLNDTSKNIDREIENYLNQVCPTFLWSVKNQARMHYRNHDKEYQSTLHAMSHWPEIQTAIGVQLNKNEDLVIKHSFKIDEYFSLTIKHNPVRSREIFERRVKSKKWLDTWPKLKVV